MKLMTTTLIALGVAVVTVPQLSHADAVFVPGAACYSDDATQPHAGVPFQTMYTSGVKFWDPVTTSETVLCPLRTEAPGINAQSLSSVRVNISDGFGCLPGQDFAKGKVSAMLCIQDSNDPFSFTACGTTRSTTCSFLGNTSLTLTKNAGALYFEHDNVWVQFELGETARIYQVRMND